MHTRLHNLLFERSNPIGSTRSKTTPSPSTAAKADLLAAIESRSATTSAIRPASTTKSTSTTRATTTARMAVRTPIGSSTAQKALPPSTRNRSAAGPSATRRKSSPTIPMLAGLATRLWLHAHVESIRQAGVDAGYGEVVDGIGLQYYEPAIRADLAAEFIDGLQNMNIQGLPTVLTEFGTFDAKSAPRTPRPSSASRCGSCSATPDSTGFLIWDWTKEDDGSDQFAPGSALYTVDAPTWNTSRSPPPAKSGRTCWASRLGRQPEQRLEHAVHRDGWRGRHDQLQRLLRRLRTHRRRPDVRSHPRQGHDELRDRRAPSMATSTAMEESTPPTTPSGATAVAAPPNTSFGSRISAAPFPAAAPRVCPSPARP